MEEWRGQNPSLLWWAGLDKTKTRGRFRHRPVARHGDCVRQRRLVYLHPNALIEITKERLPLGDLPALQEVPEVRHVPRDLLGVSHFTGAASPCATSSATCNLASILSSIFVLSNSGSFILAMSPVRPDSSCPSTGPGAGPAPPYSGSRPGGQQFCAVVPARPATQRPS